MYKFLVYINNTLKCQVSSWHPQPQKFDFLTDCTDNIIAFAVFSWFLRGETWHLLEIAGTFLC